MPIKKLMIVDDERDLVQPLALRLGLMGRWKTAVAYDGAEGLELAARFRPDIALIDLAMPVLDGWALCRGLKANPQLSSVRIILMTAWLSPDLGRRALAEGVAELLLKPFEEADLIKALEAGQEVH